MFHTKNMKTILLGGTLMKKKFISILLAAALAASLAAGCGNDDNNGNGANENTADEGNNGNANDGDNNTADNDGALVEEVDGSVYYLNFKPEQAEQWKDLAKEYSNETGIPVTIETAASGTYESTLKSEMAKSEAPTLFQGTFFYRPSLCGRRVFLHRPAWRQPSGFQLTNRSRCLCRCSSQAQFGNH